MALLTSRPRAARIKRAIELRVVDTDLDVELRVEALMGCLLRLLQGGDTRLERVLNADIPGGCIEVLVTTSAALWVEDAAVQVKVRRWPR